MRTNKAKGFTLIELMIVVAIIGILASVAIPAYNDYTQRTKLGGSVKAMDSFKTAVSLCWQERSTKVGCNEGSFGIPGIVEASLSYVTVMTLTNGVISMTSNALTSAGAEMTITMTPDLTSGVFDWNITGTGCTEEGRSIDCSGT